MPFAVAFDNCRITVSDAVAAIPAACFPKNVAGLSARFCLVPENRFGRFAAFTTLTTCHLPAFEGSAWQGSLLFSKGTSAEAYSPYKYALRRSLAPFVAPGVDTAAVSVFP